MKPASPSLPSSMQSILDRYQVEEVLSIDADRHLAGRVTDRATDEPYILRALDRRDVDASSLNRFRRLQDHIAELDHPHLTGAARIEELGDWLLILRHPSVDRDLLAAIDPTDQHLVLQSLASMAAALRALHQAGYSHGMPGPSRVRIDAVSGRLGGAWLVDAGIFWLESAPQRPGRRDHWAPELRGGAIPTPRSDLYALGSGFLALFGGDDALQALALGQRPGFGAVAPDFDPELVRIFDRLVATDPDGRFRDGDEFWEALHAPNWTLPARERELDRFISPRLVGREHAMRVIDRALAAPEMSAALEIVGAQGTGRTRLLEELGARARSLRRSVLRWSHAGPGDGLPELVEAAAAAGGVSPPAVEWTELEDQESGVRQSARLGVFMLGMMEIVRELDQPLVILIDDLDAHSDATVAGLQHLCAGIEDGGLLIVATMTESLRLPRSTVVAVDPLGEERVYDFLLPLMTEALNPEPLRSELFLASGGRPQWIRLSLASWLRSGRLSQNGGRPFFDPAVASTVPGDIGALVDECVARLRPEERSLIELVAVHGEPIPLDRLQAIQPQAASRIATPPVSALVQLRSGMASFTAETVRTAVLDRIGPERHEVCCRQLVPHLSEQSTHPGLRGRILIGAGLGKDSLEQGRQVLFEAARQADGGGDRAAALAYFRQALAVRPSGARAAADRSPLTDEELTLHLRAAGLAAQLGDHPWALDLVDGLADRLPPGHKQVARVYLELGNIARDCRSAERARDLYAEARGRAGGSLALEIDLEEAANDFFRREFDRAGELLEPLLSRLAEFASPADRAIVWNRWATIRNRQGELTEAVRFLLRAYRHAKRSGNQELVARVLNNLGSTYSSQGRFRAALQTLERARRALLLFPSDPDVASVAANLGLLYSHFNRHQEAIRSYELMRAVRHRLGSPVGEVNAMLGIANAWSRSGDIEAAIRFLQQTEAFAREHGASNISLVRGNLGEYHLRHGDVLASEAMLQRALTDDRLTTDERGILTQTLGEVYLRGGEHSRAVATLREASTLLSDLGSPFAVSARSWLGRALTAVGERDAALREVDRAARELLSLIEREPSGQGRMGTDLDRAAPASTRLWTMLSDAQQTPEYVPLEIPVMWMLARTITLDAPHEELIKGLDTALDLARAVHDPTFRAESLITALDLVGASEPVETPAIAAWLAARLADLEAVAAGTNSRLVQERCRELRRRLPVAADRLDISRTLGAGGVLQADDEAVDSPMDTASAAQGEADSTRPPRSASEPEPASMTVGAYGPERAAADSLLAENRLLRGLLARRHPGQGLLAEGVGAEEQLALLDRHAATQQPVLLAGEPGTGRSRLIVAAHLREGRRGPILPVLCAAQPDVFDQTGSLPMTNSPLDQVRDGTLLLQGAETLSRASLAQLKRWMLETDRGRQHGIWVVATVRLDIGQSDPSTRRRRPSLTTLFGEPILLPPLRNRLDELPIIIDMLVAEIERPPDAAIPRVPGEFIQLCRRYDWPGNVTELRSVVVRAAALARRGTLSVMPVPRRDAGLTPYREAELDFDHRILTRALRATGGSVPAAAKLLELPVSTFRYKLNRLELEADEESGN